MKAPAPDFVIAGAPKCGTTAVHETLRGHPGLFLPLMKEPHFFAYDFPRRREVESIEDYDRLFADAKDNQLRGESSTGYLMSKRAIPAILQRRPDAKFIILVRNPLQMFVSWHNECVKALDEDEQDPERAWRLQYERAHGRRIPVLCKEPAYLEYQRVCSLGAQIQCLFQFVSESQRLVLVYEDLEQCPGRVYEEIVRFLGVSDNGVQHFLRENNFAKPRSRFMARVARFSHQNSGARKLRARLKPLLNGHGIRPMAWLLRFNLKQAPRPNLSIEFRRELEAAFASDVQLLARLLNRDIRELWSIGAGLETSRAASHTSFADAHIA